MFDTNLLKNNGVDLDKSLELFGDIDTYNDNLDEFLDGIEKILKDIETYKNNSDMANYAILVHSVKSDAKYFGFTRLAELAYNHEMKSKANDVYYVHDNYDELITEINRIVGLVKEYMGWDYEKKVRDDLPKRNSSILVVDDSNIIASFVTKIFDNTYNVLVAKDGKEAIDKLSNLREEIAAMLLDLNMPNVDGYEVLRFMKTNDIFKDINVAIISGTEPSKVLDATKEYPIKAVLEKPFNETNVKKVVEMVAKK